MTRGRTCLVVQWLRLCSPSAGGPGWETPSYMLQQRSKIPCAATKTRRSQRNKSIILKKKKKEEEAMRNRVEDETAAPAQDPLSRYESCSTPMNRVTLIFCVSVDGILNGISPKQSLRQRLQCIWEHDPGNRSEGEEARNTYRELLV